MTEAEHKLLSPPPQVSPEIGRGKRPARRKILFFCAPVFILVGGFLATLYWLHMSGLIMPAAVNKAAASQKIAGLELKIEALDSRVTDLAARVDEIAATPASAPSVNPAQASKTSAADLTHMQSDLTALVATVSGLQAAAAAARAESVAFMQLRDAAMSGYGFAHELDALQGTVKNDPALKDLSGKLAPLAEKGAPTNFVLREQMTEQIAAADEAIAKAKAQNWRERVLAELKGLVSVRALHGPASADATLDAIQAALARDDLGAALEEIKNLPPEAQQTLDAWREKAEARRAIDENLRALADHLIADASAPPPAQDAP